MKPVLDHQDGVAVAGAARAPGRRRYCRRAPAMFSTRTAGRDFRDSFCATMRRDHVGRPARPRTARSSGSACSDRSAPRRTAATPARQADNERGSSAVTASSLIVLLVPIIAPAPRAQDQMRLCIALPRQLRVTHRKERPMPSTKVHAPGPARRRREIQELGQVGPGRRDRHAQLHQRRRTSSRPRSW